MSDDLREGSGARGLWIGLAIGSPVIAYGVVGLATAAPVGRTLAVGRWAAGLLVLHDALVVPAVLALVYAVRRWAPLRVRPPLVAGLLGTALVLALAAPGVLGLGNPSGNPTVHPFDTTVATAAALALVWATAAAWGACAVWGGLSARRRPGEAARGTARERRRSR